MMDATVKRMRTPWTEPPAEGEATEVAEGILWFRLPLPMKLDHVNVYALDDGDGWTVIDTGFSSRRSRGIWERLMAGLLGGRPVRRVIVTHHHPDHVGLAGWFQSEHGAETWATRTAWLMARMLTLDVQTEAVAETLTFWRHAGMDEATIEKRRAERPFNFADIVWPIPLGFRRMFEGEVIRAGGRDWDVRLGNGHAPDHVTLWSRDGEVVISGDQVIQTISPNLGVYATEPEADPVGEWLEACERLSAFATEDQLVLPGHKLPFTGLPHRMQQLIDNHHHALDRLEAYIDTPKTAAQCFQPLFMRTIGDGEFGLALVESLAHLGHLYREGRATRRVSDSGAWEFQRRG
jgi:glyoxylase-like metal-dependent hydrolase (beta-lactamase superfamily II)